MQIQVVKHNEDGSVEMRCIATEKESNYIMQFGVNNLLAMGAQFHQEMQEEDESQMSFDFDGDATLQ